MKYAITLLLVLLLSGTATAQQPSRPKRPVKNPPQYPGIIDLENKDAQPAPKPAAPKPDAPATVPTAPPDAQAKSINQLSDDIRALAQEVRSLNVRQQAQLDMMKMARVELRVERYERDLRPVRERLAAIEFEERNLQQLMTRESLLAQTATTATTDRDGLMAQIRAQHEARLRAIRAERERLQPIEADLNTSLGIYQKLQNEMERRIQQAEESLKAVDKPESKPQN